ncbi:hypothetical protein Tco_0824695 [Tanacetum coccineum]|uniref:Uncharacterized protein n=1 Tax=Tanacetum coccineum TaxID=301880 RepID=A0ABQ5AQC7_9ASTR
MRDITMEVLTSHRIYGYEEDSNHPPSPIEIHIYPSLCTPEYVVPSKDEAPHEDRASNLTSIALTSKHAYHQAMAYDSDLEEDPGEETPRSHADYPPNGGDRDDDPIRSDNNDDDN